MFSSKPYDDRAIILYNVDPYKEVKIKSFKSDIKSPQAVGTVINLIADVSGGRELLYRYIIEGPVCDDSGYIRGNECVWEPRGEGKYKITLKVKDISFEGDYEDVTSIQYEIFNKGVTGKENHTGLGLWEVKQILKKNNNINLYTNKNDTYFSQQLEIYY